MGIFLLNFDRFSKKKKINPEIVIFQQTEELQLKHTLRTLVPAKDAN